MLLYMRTDNEMFDLIINTAKEDARIRAVVMNGSRANKSIKNDCFQDYDIRYIVNDKEPFRDETWIRGFGEIMILQKPNEMGVITEAKKKSVVYLMQFMDGTRIDLTVLERQDFVDDGEPTVVLLDKDNILPEFPTPTGEVYHVTPPTNKQFKDTCNEFWWLNPYIAKGLWRNELPYVKYNMDYYLRNEFMKMLNWYIGIGQDFKISTGKMGKYLKDYLSEKEWEEFEHTYADSKSEHIWESLFIMNDMFRRIGEMVAEHFGYVYPKEDDKRVTSYLQHIRTLSKDAKSIY